VPVRSLKRMRMGRVLFGVGAALVLCLVVLGLAVYLTADEDNIGIDNLVSENITRAVALAEDPDEGAKGIVDLREIAPFRWDRVLLVAPGTPKATISQELGYEWKGQVGIDAGDLLIFMNGSDVARFADYRGRGIFAGFTRPIAEIPRERAVFRVRALTIRLR
jgi:hypothetical protein